MKKPWLAALLNLIPLGFGYLYLRRFRRFGATLLVGTMAGFVLFLGVPLTIYACYYECSEAVVLFILIMLLSLPGAVAAFTAWNAWRLASGAGPVLRLFPKRPWLAALLNMIPLGIGYAYLGRWRRFLLVFVCFPIGWVLAGQLIVLMGGLLTLIWSWAPPTLVAAFTAWNAWRLASRDGASP